MRSVALLVLAIMVDPVVLRMTGTGEAAVAAVAPADGMRAAIGVLQSHGTGVAIAVGTAMKHAENPLFAQDRPWESTNGGSINNGYPNVVRTAAGFSLWYGICAQGCNHQIVGFANSTDGLTWAKPNLHIFSDWAKNNRADLSGTANNIVMQGGGVGVYFDQHEPDASQRYKGFGGTEGRNANASAVGACFGPGGSSGCIGGGTGTSPDGLHWSNAKAVTWPSPQRYDCHNNLFYDAPNKSYVATTRDGFSGALGRTIGLTRSAPGKGFDFSTKASPPMIEHGDKDHQLYSQVTWPWRGIYLGIVMVFDAVPSGKPGYDGSKVHCRLSYARQPEGPWTWVSKDGLTGGDIIPLGKNSNAPGDPGYEPGLPNDFDSHICFAAAPVHDPIAKQEMLFYMGGNGPHNGARNSSFALATLREDGFAGVRGSGKAKFELTCFGPAPCTTISATADVLGAGGSWTLAPSSCAAFTGNGTNKACALGAAGPVAAGGTLTATVELRDAIIYTLGLS